MVRDEIRKIIKKAVQNSGAKPALGQGGLLDFSVEYNKFPKNEYQGDYSTNVLLQIAKILKKKPMEIAKDLMIKLHKSKEANLKFDMNKIKVVKPGFINFYLSKEYLQKQLEEILNQGEEFGDLKIGKKEKINVEFISANPTGPLTLGNARGGFSGDVLSNVLEKAGYDVCREFYINDRGKQIKDLKKGLYKGENRTVVQIQKANQKFIIEDLKIKFDNWFSEKSLYKNKEVDKALTYLKKKKLTYQKEGALWFKSTKFGDDKDRVLIKEDGEYTYLASDIAYLKNKFQRGFKKLIFFWGADHHGYTKRIESGAQALGYKKEQLDFIVMQLVNLKQGRMSKRAGLYISLEKLIKEVGLDVARFFFLQRGANSHLIFDLELAKKKSQENPVYYVQYAYARIFSILKKSKIQNSKSQINPKFKIQNSKLLNHSSELNLIKQLVRFPEIIEDTAATKDYQVQRIPQYAVELSESFHRFYQDCQVISDDKEKTQARLALILATKVVLEETLKLMGINALQKM